MNSRKVNFFVIGQPKTGTTALYHYLKIHSGIFLTEQKQLHHFATDFNNHRKKFKKLNRKYYSDYYNYSFNTYIKRFEFDDNFKNYGDITPDYFYSSEAANNIYKYNPEANIIAIIREPFDFLKSFHGQLVSSGCEYETDFFKALQLGQFRNNEEGYKQNPHCPPALLSYSDLIEYEKCLSRYYNLFGDRLKIIIYEDFKYKNINYINKICNLLNVDTVEYESEIKENVSAGKPNKFLAFRKLYINRVLSSVIPWKWKRSIKKLFRDQSAEKTIVDERKYSEIEKEFKVENKSRISDLNKFIVENNLLLSDTNEDLLEVWGYNEV